jgi:hypothetical protein
MQQHQHFPPPHPTHQPEVARLQAALSAQEGTNKLLRTNLEQVERDRATLRQRLAQLEGRPGGGGAQGPGSGGSAVVGEMRKQVEQLKEQLMFKDQEVCDFCWYLRLIVVLAAAVRASTARFPATMRPRGCTASTLPVCRAD